MTTLCDGNHPDLSTWGGSCFSWRLAYQHVDVLDKIMVYLVYLIYSDIHWFTVRFVGVPYAGDSGMFSGCGLNYNIWNVRWSTLAKI